MAVDAGPEMSLILARARVPPDDDGLVSPRPNTPGRQSWICLSHPGGQTGLQIPCTLVWTHPRATWDEDRRVQDARLEPLPPLGREVFFT
jgi:hypothetical protein